MKTYLVDGEKVKKIVKRSGLNKREFAKKVGLADTTIGAMMNGGYFSEKTVSKFESALKTQIICEEKRPGMIDVEKIEKMSKAKKVDIGKFFEETLGRSRKYWYALKTGKICGGFTKEQEFIICSILDCRAEDLYIKEEPKKEEAKQKNELTGEYMGVANYLINMNIKIDNLTRIINSLSEAYSQIMGMKQDDARLTKIIEQHTFATKGEAERISAKLDSIMKEFDIKS